MFQHFVILSCLICLFIEIYAIDWCSCDENCLDGLLQCLLKTFDVHDWTDQLDLRLHCAKQAYCTPKPLDILDSEIRIINNFAECMKTIPGVQEFEIEARFNSQLQNLQKTGEFKCRNELVEGLPDKLKVWWSVLLQTPLP